ncbi:MAG: hypothetical protein JXA42_10130 [Anaerolineales bacterium]|nr:hypothetical protein [Anaerolineales bacterium]
MNKPTGVQKTVIKKDLYSLENDFAYWQSQPYQARLETLEQIRQEYHKWRYGVEPGFHRVYQIVKR